MRRAEERRALFEPSKGPPRVLLDKRTKAGDFPVSAPFLTEGRGGTARAAVTAPAMSRAVAFESQDGGETWAKTASGGLTQVPQVLEWTLQPLTNAFRLRLEPGTAGQVEVEAQWWPVDSSEPVK